MIILLQLTKEELTEIRKEKLRKEIESATRLLQSGIEPLKVADGFFHDIFLIFEEGIRNRNPQLSTERTAQLIEDTLTYGTKFKNNRQRRSGR